MTQQQTVESKSQQKTFPLSNTSYDLIALIHKKSKALETYEKYLNDIKDDSELLKTVENMRKDDHRHVEELKTHLTRLLNKDK